MSKNSGRFINQIRRARREGGLLRTFRANDLRVACPGWAFNTYSTFLPKHRVGNPCGTTELFVRYADESYGLVEESADHLPHA